MILKHEARILILDDEVELAQAMQMLLSKHFSHVVDVYSYNDAIKELETVNYDVVISDFKMGAKTGLDLRKWLMIKDPHCQFILLTGYSNDPDIIEHLRIDHFKVLQKPAPISELILPLKKDFPKKEAA